MSDPAKRLDLRFGAFACSVQGFDDPVQPVQQVLRALQHLLEETPELADAGISFDAEAIERLVEEVARRADLASEDVEITPGLIIVHRGERDRTVAPAGAADARGDDEAWARPFAQGTGGEDLVAAESSGGAPAPEADDGAGHAGYVNIFARQAHGDEGADSAMPRSDAAVTAEEYLDLEERRAPAATRTDDAADSPGADMPFATRLERLDDPAGDHEAEAGEHIPLRGVIGGDGSPAAGASVFVDPEAGTAPERSDVSRPENLFADPDALDEPLRRPEGNLLTRFELAAHIDHRKEAPERADAPDGDVSDRIEALFGDADDQPAASDDGGNGYTAAGLAKAAGAETVEDLMVCAAAWMVLIKGQTRFARRDVIDVFDALPGDHPKTLEAKIRGFGKAVRNGHLVMVGDGAFGISRTDLEHFESLL